jgi:hypothetical protein
MSVSEGISYLVTRLMAKLPPAPALATEVYEIPDEDDADLSTFEEEVVVQGYSPREDLSPREYLKSTGAL